MRMRKDPSGGFNRVRQNLVPSDEKRTGVAVGKVRRMIDTEESTRNDHAFKKGRKNIMSDELASSHSHVVVVTIVAESGCAGCGQSTFKHNP
jgi:hypothetical protein